MKTIPIPVMPAKADIQVALCLHEEWTPACAGVTTRKSPQFTEAVS